MTSWQGHKFSNERRNERHVAVLQQNARKYRSEGEVNVATVIMIAWKDKILPTGKPIE